MSDIFFSYASEDRERIIPLVRALESMGWSLFWDRVIPPGKTWRQVIGAEIKNCRCIIVVWSQKSVESEWVQEEAEDAKRRQILVPVLIDDVIPPFGFGNIQAADFTQWNGSTSSPGFDELGKAIASLLGSLPAAPKEKEQRQQEEELRRAEEERRRAKEEKESQKIEEEQKRALKAELAAERERRRKAETKMRELEEEAEKERLQPNLPDILPGNWQAEINVAYGLSLSGTFNFDRQGNFVGQILNPMLGVTPVQGRWSASSTALTLQGQQIVAFIATPYFTTIQFSAMGRNELRGTSSAGEQVTFRLK